MIEAEHPEHLKEMHEAVLGCLDDIVDPCSAANGTHFSLVEMGIVKAVTIEDGSVTVRLRLTSPSCFMLEYFLVEIRKHVGALDGVTEVEVEADGGLEWEPSMMNPDRRRDYLDAVKRSLPMRARA